MSGATLAAIYVYPVKSARGIALSHADVGDRGLEHDRRFMVVDAFGHMLTQRVVGALARLQTSIGDDALHLCFEGAELTLPLQPTTGAQTRARVFQDTVDALDLGADARRFLSHALGREASLVYMPDETRRRVDPKRAAEHDIVGFADGFPYLLASEDSLAALNRELASPVGIERFRPNFVVRGLAAYAEDALGEWTIDGIPFLALKPSSRCVIVNTDQRTGVREKGVFETLVRVHSEERKPLFGQNLVARGSGSVRLGAAVVPAGISAPLS